MPNLVLPSLIIDIHVSGGIARQREMLFEVGGDGGGYLGVRKRPMREGLDVSEDSKAGDGECLKLFECDVECWRALVAAVDVERVCVSREDQVRKRRTS